MALTLDEARAIVNLMGGKIDAWSSSAVDGTTQRGFDICDPVDRAPFEKARFVEIYIDVTTCDVPIKSLRDSYKKGYAQAVREFLYWVENGKEEWE